ncbi:hypothetical protein, partial [Actinoplanes siamensis]|uniref:hypothetical protein n=1 Tax=Actinoplanes siamensis TaxID=1223317 RepID=UPI001940C870
ACCAQRGSCPADPPRSKCYDRLNPPGSSSGTAYKKKWGLYQIKDDDDDDSGDSGDSGNGNGNSNGNSNNSDQNASNDQNAGSDQNTGAGDDGYDGGNPPWAVRVFSGR